jgi:hypothetical protein
VTDPRVKALLKLGLGRMGSVTTPGWARILATMSDQAHAGFRGQRAFAACRRQGAVARAGRGGGKSFGMVGRFHAVSAANPNQAGVFITISAERSRDILTPAVWKFNELFGAGITEKRGDGIFEWPNGFRVLYRGCKDINECNKRRGTPWAAAGWDECASLNQKLFEYDIHECVEPRLIDLNGRWFAGGTPGPIQTGYFYKISSGDEHTYPLFCWDARHNPHMPNVLKFFVDTLQRMQGIPERRLWPPHCKTLLDLINDPACWKLLPSSFVREYLGQWVLDLRALIYKITPKNTYSELPIEPDYWTIGCDLGAHSEEEPDLDHAAVSVACSNRSLPYIWVPEAKKLSGITVESLAAYLCQKLEQYPKASVHIDSASAGKIMELSFQKMGIPIQAAVKGPKLRRIQLAQSAIANGNLQIHIRNCMDLRHEATALVWNDKRDNHSERCDDDAWDSALMAMVPHFGDYRPEEEDVKPGSKEWVAAQEMAEYEEALREAIDEAGLSDQSLPPWAQPWLRAA